MKISVLLTTFGRPAYLERCVQSLLVQQRPPDQIVLVTRAGDTETEDWVAAFLDQHSRRRTSIKVDQARVEAPGVLAANIAGFPLLTGDIVSFIDDDAAAHPDWLARVEAWFASDPGIGAVGGRDVLHGPAGIIAERATRVGEITWYGRIIGNHEKAVGGVHDVDHLKGVNMSLRRCLVEGFDERILGNAHYYEMDLCLAVRAQGYRIVYDSRIVVDHYQTAPRFLAGNAIATDPMREYYLNHNRVYVMTKRLGLARRSVFLAYTFTRDPAVGLLKLLIRWRGARPAQLGMMLKGMAAGLAGHRRRRRALAQSRQALRSGPSLARRVLYLVPTSELGGAERCLLELLRELPRSEYEPHLLLPRPGPLHAAAAALGAKVSVQPWPSMGLKAGRERSLLNRLLAPVLPLLLLPAAVRAARYARRESIDLMHTNGTKAHLVGTMASLLARISVLWHLRDVVGPGPLRSLLRSLGRTSPRCIIANSAATASSMGENHPRVTLIHDGISLEEFKPRDIGPGLRASLGLESAAFVIGTVGALAPLKGHIHLLRAMPSVLREAPEARLLIVGAEMYETIGHRGHLSLLKEEAERLGIAGKVIFAGSRDDVALLYNLMDLVALCSVRPESFGRVLVEAMACQRPVIATDLGGPKEILEGGECGLLVPPADAGALSSALLELRADPARRTRMGTAGRKRVEERFPIERTMSSILRVYEQLIEARDTTARRPVKEALR